MKRYALFSLIFIAAMALLLQLPSCGGGEGGGGGGSNKSMIMGEVKDSNSDTIGGVKVSAGGKTTTSNAQGFFSLDVPPTDRLVVNFTKEGYVSASKITKMPSGQSIYLEPVITQYEQTDIISAIHGGIVSTADGGAVDIDPDSLVDSSGSTYNGLATIAITTFDPTTETGANSFPGDFEGVTTSGETVAFESYGFVDITILDENGNALQLAPGQPAFIKIPIAPRLVLSAPNSIPLWYYDTTDGKWYEDGSAIKFGDIYEGEVTHFSPWNADGRILEFCTVRGRVVDSNGNPIRGATVIIRGAAGAGPVWSAGDTSIGEDGTFSLRVAADRQATIQVTVRGVSSEPQFITTCFRNETNNLGDITLSGFSNTGEGLITGASARAQFENFQVSLGDTFIDFESFTPQTNLTNEVPGVVFRTTRDRAFQRDDPISTGVNVICPATPFSTTPCVDHSIGGVRAGNITDGQSLYEIVFDTPQLRAGIIRNWNTAVTRFYSGTTLLAGYQSTVSDEFVGFIADTDLITRIELDGLLVDVDTYNVGYSDDLFFGVVPPN